MAGEAGGGVHNGGNPNPVPFLRWAPGGGHDLTGAQDESDGGQCQAE